MGFLSIYLLFLIKFAKKKWAPMRYVPETLVVVVLGTLVCGLARLDKYNVAILGHIEQGIPLPSPPRLDKIEIIATFLGDAGVIALVGFVEHIVAGKTYATKNGYPISANRELVALGSLNGIGSFFHTYPTFASVRN
jgi:sulfate permease, SulP family